MNAPARSSVATPARPAPPALGPRATPATRPVAEPGQKLARLFCGLYAVILLVIVTSIWALIARDKQRELDRQQTELVSLARALEEHVARTIGHMDSGLQFLARLLSHETRISQESLDTLSTYAQNWLKSAPHAAALSISDERGRSLLLVQQPWLRAAATYPPAGAAAWRARPDAPMRVGLPIKLATEAGEEWFIPVELGIAGIDRKLVGVASGLISTRYFEQFYRDIQFAPRDAVSLQTLDGHLLLRYPMQDDQMARLQPVWSPLDSEGRMLSQSVFFSGEQSLSGERYITAWRRMLNYPLLLSISRPRELALATYFEMRTRLVVGGTLLLVLLALTTWIVFHDTRQRELDRAELSRINASLEDRVSRRTAELEQSNRDLVGFSYSISHDLRAPLRAINGFAHALEEDCGERLDAQARDHLSRIRRASVRMGELIDELLNLANVSRRPLNVKALNLSTIASDIVAELRITEPERKIEVTIQPDMHAEGDEALLRNALSNLLHNAWKFTRDEPHAHISITALPATDGMEYTVTDNGVGFDMAHAKRLFQPFQQLHGGQGFGGSGIGLASVRRIIERHGGHIQAESSPGLGARFVFLLPHRVAVVRRRRQPQT